MTEMTASVRIACLIGAAIVVPLIVHKLETALRVKIAAGTDRASREASFQPSRPPDDDFPSDDRNREWDIYWRSGGLFNQERDDD